jgi:predicted transcriptional regulator
MKLLLYCTKARPYLADFKGDYQTYSNGKELDELFDKGFNPNDIMNILNDKIVAECDFEVSIHNWYNDYSLFEKLYYQENMIFNNENSCMSSRELVSYLGNNNLKKDFYAIHIKNLHIFDKPRELYDCLVHPKIESKYYGCEHLSKATQNMMYVELDDIKYILISIQPQWLCKILNGEKTIEVRKKVLKEMLG